MAVVSCFTIDYSFTKTLFSKRCSMQSTQNTALSLRQLFGFRSMLCALLALSAASIGAAQSAHAGIVYSAGGDLKADMQGPQTNPYGPWAYGTASTALGGSFQNSVTKVNTGSAQGWEDPVGLGPLTLVNVSNTVLNVPDPLNPGQAFMHGGPSQANGYAEFLFTAPVTSWYAINATFTPLNTGNDDVHVVVNNASVFSDNF